MLFRARMSIGRLALVATAVGVFVLGACSGDRPEAGSGAGTTTEQKYCDTPNSGCPCEPSGLVVPCGKLERRSGDYVTCAMGQRACSDGTWTACIGDDVVIKNVSTGISTRALGAPQPCPTTGPNAINPCDPYCHYYDDNPAGVDPGDGGVSIVDGAITIPGAGGGGGGGGSIGYVGTSNGVSGCSPNRNAGPGKACTAPGYATCQQDSHCEGGACLWNAGPGWYDSTLGGPDLTVGAPCGPQGSAPSTAPVCNRGSVAVPAGATITFHKSTGPSPPNGCTNLGAPAFTFTLADKLDPGKCASFTVANSPGAKFITINAGAPGSQPVNEAAGTCANNSAYWRTDGSGGDCALCQACDTRVTGKVYDPSGASPTAGANNLPLPGIGVFQAAGALTTFSNGVACDTCTSLESPSITKAVTDATGTFTLTNVAPSPNARIVVQSGRWRRQVTMNVPACQTTTVPAGTLRMPKNRTEGDIPKTALVLGDQETLECMFRKMGVDATEIGPRTGAADAKRIQLWQTNGMTTSPAAPAITGLVNSTTVLNEYNALIWDCDGGPAISGSYSDNATAAQMANLQTYTNVGGRMFVDHFPGDLIRNGPAPNNTVATWTSIPQSGIPTYLTGPKRGKVLGGAPANQLLYDWLEGTANAMTDYGAPYIRVDQPRRHAVTPDPTKTVQWIRGESSNNWASNPGGDISYSFSFETPVNQPNCGVVGGRGRVIYNGMHVSGTRHTGGGFPGGKPFPGNCNLSLGLTPEEKALEYQLFQLTACQLGGEPPPPPPVTLTPVYFVRDFEGVCNAGLGEYPEWQFLYWQGTIPPGTSIEFRAATADTIAALPPSPPPAAPATVEAGTATTTVLAPAWGSDANTVSWHLANDPPGPAQLSKHYLRVYMKFNPVGALAPTLSAWRMTYSCVPKE